MRFKFYIYRQSVFVNFDKYDLSHYTLLREVTQCVQWGLKIQRDNEFYTVIRKEFNGAIQVKGDDFNALIAIDGDTKQYAVVIKRECANVWSEYWKGYFSYFDFKVDLDRCVLSFEPQAWDEYARVYDQFPINRNILGASLGTTVLMDSYEWPTEEVTVESGSNGYPAAASWYEYNPFSPPSPNEYYLYSQNTINVCSNCSAQFLITYTFRREYGFSTSDVIPPVGTNWVVIPDEYSPGVWKWVRPVGNSVFQTYTTVNSGYNRYETLDIPATQNIDLNGCITLKSVLEYFADFMGLTYTSNFFNDDPCPMGGTTLNLTMLEQNSNIRETEETATKGMMTLKDLLTWIRDTFNAYWYIDSNGDFRIEHRKYFDYGLSYSSVSSTILDIGALFPDNTKKLRRYEWSKPSIFRFEILEIPFSYFTDWVESKIEYTQMSINGNESTTKSPGWGTDAIAMKNAEEEIPKVGWLLLNVDWVDLGGGISVKKVINTVGALSGIGFQNARFSSANLLRDLWTWGRLLPSGNVNGVATNFNSIERLRKQVELSIPECCDVIDYNGIFRTQLGDGILESGEFESKTGMLKLQLIYE